MVGMVCASSYWPKKHCVTAVLWEDAGAALHSAEHQNRGLSGDVHLLLTVLFLEQNDRYVHTWQSQAKMSRGFLWVTRLEPAVLNRG